MSERPQGECARCHRVLYLNYTVMPRHKPAADSARYCEGSHAEPVTRTRAAAERPAKPIDFERVNVVRLRRLLGRVARP